MEFHEAMPPVPSQTRDEAVPFTMDEMKYRESRQLGAVRHVVVKGAVDVLFRRSGRPELLVAGSDA